VLGRIFDGIRDKVRAPIRFVVQTVLNDGLLGAYNWIASKFGVKPDDVHVALPAGFAAGGFISGPGGPRDDAILARLSAGEYVIPAHVVSAWGIDFFDRLIGKGGVQGVARPGDGSQGIALPAFADGGLVGFLKSTWNALTDPIGWVKGKVSGLVDKIPGAGVLTGVMAGLGHKLIDGALGFVGRAITNLTRSTATAGRSPRTWPSCRAGSGSRRASPTSGPAPDRQASTAAALWAPWCWPSRARTPTGGSSPPVDEAGWFRKPPGASPLTAGWANPGERGGGSVGHTSGNLAGLAFEATPPRVLVGSVHSPVTSFAHIGSYDTGGVLPPGLTIARNDTGRDEYVLTGDQMRALGGRSGRGDITIPVYGSTASPAEIAAMVKHELAWELR
jgi:hypothetical protein